MIPQLRLVSEMDARAPETPDTGLQAIVATGLQDIVSCRGEHGGLVQHVLNTGKPVLWVQDHMSRAEFGAPQLKSVSGMPDILYAPVGNARDTLWAMEEAVKAGLNVVGEIEGAPKVLDFTATRRLEMFSRAAGVRCLLVRTGRQAQTGGSSGAHWRWRVEMLESEIHPLDPRAPGNPRWSLELLRARSRPPGRWTVELEANPDEPGTPHRLRVVSPLAVGDMAAGTAQRQAGEGWGRDAQRIAGRTGNVVALR